MIALTAKMVLLSKSKVMFWRKVVNENLSRSVGKAVEGSERRGKSVATYCEDSSISARLVRIYLS
jgi:hypothetical protein